MRLFRLLQRALPPDFRARHGDEMERVFLELFDEARRRGSIHVVWLYLRTLWDVVRTRMAMGSIRRGEEVVGMTSLWDGLVGDVRTALRGLRRAPGYAASATATLGLGVGTVTAVFAVVSGVVLSPLPYPDPDALVVLYNEYPTLDVTRGRQSPGDLADYQEQATMLSAVGSVSMYPQTLLENGLPARVDVALVTPGFFRMLGVSPQLGRDITPEDDHDVVILSHGYWQSRYGGDVSVIGASVQFAGTPKTVIGVLPADFRLVTPPNFGVPAAPDLWTPIPAQGWGRDTRDRTAHWMNLIGRMEAGSSVEGLREQLDGVAAYQRALLSDREERQARIAVHSLHDEIVREVRPALLALLAAAALVVLIAGANVANLLLVRTQRRRAEFALRTAIGGTRVRLARQWLTEGLVIGAAGAVLGALLALAAVESLVVLAPESLPRGDSVRVDGTALAFAGMVAVAATLLCSLLPVWFSTSADPGRALRDGARSGPTRHSAALSGSIIVSELALAVVLLLGSGLLARTVASLATIDPGFETEQVLTFQAPLPSSAFRASPGGPPPPAHNSVRKPYYDELIGALAAIPGVESTAAVFPTPLSGDHSSSTYATPETVGNEEGRLASSQLVTPGYFETVGIRFIEGRTFLPEEAGDKVVIDRSLAEELWPNESALGKRLQVGWWSGPVWADVIGVVESVRTHTIREPNPPTLYRLGTVYAYSGMTVAMRVTRDLELVSEAVREAVATIQPEAPVINARPMSAYLDDQTATIRFLLSLVGVFGAVSLGLAAIGLYGVVSYAVGQRVREFGIRLAFGAGRQRVFALVLKRVLLLAVVGSVTGLGVAWLVRGLIEPYLFGVGAADAPTIALVVGALAVVSIVASAAPAGRAMLVDPIESLKSH